MNNHWKGRLARNLSAKKKRWTPHYGNINFQYFQMEEEVFGRKEKEETKFIEYPI